MTTVLAPLPKGPRFPTALIFQATPRQSGKLVPDGRSSTQNGALDKHRRSIAPLCLFAEECCRIPEDALPVAAARFQTGNLLAQFLCDQMILVPILNHPWV